MIAMLTLFSGAGSLIASTMQSCADVKIEKTIFSSYDISITNTITQSDADKIAQRATEFGINALRMTLTDSSGGDVDAAIQIGRIIRENDATVYVDGKCYSSCALIYIAGVTRINSGVIGLHRPYFGSTPQSRQSVERQLPLMLQKVKSYVQEMGVADNFYQEMINTEPSKMKLYEGGNIQKIVPTLDPTYDEIKTSYEALKYGIDTQEMRQRILDSDKICSENRNNGLSCDEAVKFGLSERVFEQRVKTIQKRCDLSNEENNTLFVLTKWKDRRDHPLWIKWMTCRRNIILGR